MSFPKFFLAVPVLLFAGCAKSPVGGPTRPQANNILSVSIALQGQVRPDYYYDFAFDDDEDPSDGPIALVNSTTTYANGVTGGSFTVLVRYSSGGFIAYRRSVNSDRSENLLRSTNAFTVPPSPSQDGRTLSFALNLDATVDKTGERLFRGSDNGIPRLLDVNFVTTNQINIDPTNNLRNTFDALGARTGDNALHLNSTNQPKLVLNSDRNTEPAGDVTNFSNLESNDINSLDITDFRIEIQRN